MQLFYGYVEKLVEIRALTLNKRLQSTKIKRLYARNEKGLPGNNLIKREMVIA
ncbi:hypothetical protein BH20ACI2_BH20ACI2_19160 [soil metagenome]